MHLFGGLTPRNVWDCTVVEFHVLAGTVDARRRAVAEANRKG